MNVWAIADPHLSINSNKPMHVFGAHWDHHHEKMAEAWRNLVADEDLVLLPGDISWAMTLAESGADLAFLNSLPGIKIISRGNHDYWWTSLKKMQAFCEANALNRLVFMRNNAFRVGLTDGENLVICGSRGWINPTDSAWRAAADEAIFRRELGRLKLSLTAAESLLTDQSVLLVALHYPPFNRQAQPNELTDLLEACSVDLCLYGHVHGLPGSRLPEGVFNAIEYINVASDHLSFVPRRIWQGNGGLLDGF